MTGEERAVVKTTVPRYQKAIWKEHAEELGMSQSEFLRTMTQAGRRGFELDPPETHSPAAPPGGDGLEDHVLASLSSDDFVTFDEIVDPLIEDLETRVDEILQLLRDEKRIDHSARLNGYRLNGAPNGND